MITFPNCKINLGLNVIRKRDDGYHDISTCFYPVAWNDILEIIPAQKTELIISGNHVDGDPTDNLVMKAYQLLKDDFNLPPLKIYLHKIIPSGAGLGGGSSDGAHMLKLLNDHFKLNISDLVLEKYALQLGSDCPFFIQNKPLIAKGRGEVFKSLVLSLKGKFILIVKPDIHVSTAEAYGGVTPKEPVKSIEEILSSGIDTWQSELANDFEPGVFKNHPELSDLKNQIINSGALYASMSGSGSAVFGIYDTKPSKLSWGNAVEFVGKL